MKWTDESAFINRQNELEFLHKWIRSEPKHLLFIYGCKSSGKTTLLLKFIDELKPSETYDVKFFNLRQILITNYKDFLQTFFEVDPAQKKSAVKETRQYDLKVFKLTVEAMKGLQTKEYDPFVVMKTELEKLVDRGIRPVIIIDELQALSEIYMNGQRELLKELFNFFVSITKELHLCHVVISSSDGYFIERIYSDSRLLKTSSFFEVDYLPQDDVRYWLHHLKKESKIDNLTLTDAQIERIWYYFGGSMWEISKLLSELQFRAENGGVSDEVIEHLAKKEITAYKIRFKDYVGQHYDRDLFLAVNAYLQTHDTFDDEDLPGDFDRAKLKAELAILVQKNLFAYDPMTGEYKPQGHSLRLGLEWFCNDLESKQ